jgi:hypothetical protein
MVVATPPPARTARKATGKAMELGRMRSTTSPARMRRVRRRPCAREETRWRRSAQEREVVVAASRRHGGECGAANKESQGNHWGGREVM